MSKDRCGLCDHHEAEHAAAACRISDCDCDCFEGPEAPYDVVDAPIDEVMRVVDEMMAKWKTTLDWLAER